MRPSEGTRACTSTNTPAPSTLRCNRVHTLGQSSFLFSLLFFSFSLPFLFRRSSPAVLAQVCVCMLVHVVRSRAPCVCGRAWMSVCVQYTPLTAVNAPNFRGVFTFAMFMTAKRCQRVETRGESGAPLARATLMDTRFNFHEISATTSRNGDGTSLAGVRRVIMLLRAPERSARLGAQFHR